MVTGAASAFPLEASSAYSNVNQPSGPVRELMKHAKKRPTAAPTEETDRTEMNRRGLRRYWPLLALAVGLGLFFAFDLGHYLDFETLRDHRGWLMARVEDHAIVAALAFMGVYAAATAISAPGGTFMTICGGFLFGPALATVYVVFGATAGATLLFLAARFMFYDALHARAGPWMDKMEAGFQKNALSYLLALRLVPAFPFFIVNLVPAFLNVPLKTYIIGTFFGIIPGTFVYTWIGAGLGSVFDHGDSFTAEGLLTLEIAVALSGLALLALAPVAYKALKAQKRS
jgi:uncharacterized membrane protein YdjX (TVP38/TMEM64 family)